MNDDGIKRDHHHEKIIHKKNHYATKKEPRWKLYAHYKLNKQDILHKEKVCLLAKQYSKNLEALKLQELWGKLFLKKIEAY